MNARRVWEGRLERHRDHARLMFLLGAVVCGVGAMGATPPPGTQPLDLGSLRTALELWSRLFFQVAGPAALLYGLAVALGLLYVGRGAMARRSARGEFHEIAPTSQQREAA